MAGFARAQQKASGGAARPGGSLFARNPSPVRNISNEPDRGRPRVPAFDLSRIAVYPPEPLRNSSSQALRRPGLRQSSIADGAALASAVYDTTRRSEAGASAPLPHLEQIQRSFGHHDLSRVRTYQESRAASVARSIDARAYTAGDHIAFAGSPDLRTAAHEAAHVVQQRAGIRLPGQFSQPDDAYERHANAVADRVAQNRSAEPLLNEITAAASSAPHTLPPVVQREGIGTDFGTFKTAKYDTVGAASHESGIDIELDFDPDPAKVNAKKIALTQSVHNQLGGTDTALYPVEKNRMVPSGTGAGSQIDRYGGGNFGNPLYATDAPAAADKLETTATVASWGQHGFHYKEGDTVKHQIAILKDKPTLPGHGKNSGQSFESAAVAVEGVQSGKYMGSVTWGWSSDGTNKFTKQPMTLKEKGDPSAEFQAAAKQWNATSVGGTVKTITDPTTVFKNDYSADFTVAKDTEVTVTGAAPIHNDETYDEAKVKTGPKANSTGRIKVSDLKETGGTAAIKLPTP